MRALLELYALPDSSPSGFYVYSKVTCLIAAVTVGDKSVLAHALFHVTRHARLL